MLFFNQLLYYKITFLIFLPNALNDYKTVSTIGFSYSQPTLHSSVNRCLSSGGLPLLAGYSQSRSRPSKLILLRNVITFCANSSISTALSTSSVNGPEPCVQPPIANNIFNFGLTFFKFAVSSYFPIVKNQTYITLYFQRIITYKFERVKYPLCIAINKKITIISCFQSNIPNAINIGTHIITSHHTTQ